MTATFIDRNAKTTRGIAATVILVLVLAVIATALVYIGIPVLAGVLIFPALGVTGSAVAGLTALLTLGWCLILGTGNAISSAIRAR
ncbi:MULTISPECIES: hypothetical protein [Bacteria]|uniref:hypothetical protein n=1 Tax=Bacteria TaxID=2 RepID=UPI003C7A6AEA